MIEFVLNETNFNKGINYKDENNATEIDYATYFNDEDDDVSHETFSPTIVICFASLGGLGLGCTNTNFGGSFCS